MREKGTITSQAPLDEEQCVNVFLQSYVLIITEWPQSSQCAELIVSDVSMISCYRSKMIHNNSLLASATVTVDLENAKSRESYGLLVSYQVTCKESVDETWCLRLTYSLNKWSQVTA